MEYAERAEYMYVAPGQATVSVLLALFWLKVAEKVRPMESSNPTKPPRIRWQTNEVGRHWTLISETIQFVDAWGRI